MKKTFVFFLVACCFHVHAQITYKGSSTISPLGSGERDLVLGMQENGFAVLFDSGKDNKWTLCHYDQYLHIIRTTSLEIKGITWLSAHQYTDHKLYLLFKTGVKKSNLLSYDPVSGELKNLDIPVKNYFHVNGLQVSGNFAYLDGFLWTHHQVLQVDLQTGNVNELLEGEKLTYNEIQPLEGMGMAVFSLQYTDTIPALYFSVFNRLGQRKLDHILIPPYRGKYPFTAKMLVDEDSSIVITGQFKLKGKNGSQGLYFTRWKQNNFSNSNFYSFDDFDHLYAYLSPDEKKAEGEKERKQKEQGHENFLNLQLLENKLLKTPQGYLLVTERFQHTIDEQPVELPLNSEGVIKTKMSLEPVNYTSEKIMNLMAVSFGKNGEKLWDQTTALPKEYNYSGNLLTQTTVQEDQSHVVLLWNDQLYDMAMDSSGNIQYWDRKVEPDVAMEGFFSQFIVLPNGKIVIMGMKKETKMQRGKYVLALQLYYFL